MRQVGILKQLFYIIRKLDGFFILSKTTNEKGFYFYFAKNAHIHISKGLFLQLAIVYINLYLHTYAILCNMHIRNIVFLRKTRPKSLALSYIRVKKITYILKFLPKKLICIIFHSFPLCEKRPHHKSSFLSSVQKMVTYLKRKSYVKCFLNMDMDDQ